MVEDNHFGTQEFVQFCRLVGAGTAGLDQLEALFAEKGRDLDALLLGEMERFLTYPALGHIAQPDIPQEVLDADRMLRK